MTSRECGHGDAACGIVIGPHESVLAETIHQLAAARVAEERRIDLFVDIFAGQFLHERQRHFGLEAGVIFVPLVGVERQPGAFVFDVDQFQFRKTREHAGEDQIEQSIRRVVDLVVDRGFVGVEPLALEAAVVETR